VVIVPDVTLSTARARQALPSEVSRESASFNLSRMALLMAGMADCRLLIPEAAEDRLGVTRTNGIPSPPASNNFKVMGNGAKRVGYTGVSTGRMAFNTVPRDGRPATIQDGFNYQGDKQPEVSVFEMTRKK